MKEAPNAEKVAEIMGSRKAEAEKIAAVGKVRHGSTEGSTGCPELSQSVPRWSGQRHSRKCSVYSLSFQNARQRALLRCLSAPLCGQDVTRRPIRVGV